MDDTSQTPQKPRASQNKAPKTITEISQWISQLFAGLRWLTEHAVSLLRLTGTLALLIAVVYVLYNVYQSRHTVVVKPFEVSVTMKSRHHEQAGRIIANILKFHLLAAQSRFQDEVTRHQDHSGGLLYTPLSRRSIIDSNALFGTGGDIKLPETGISIDNMIEFISGMFGRKNLTGAVYIDQEKLYLQIVLHGRILIISEDDLSSQQREKLPATNSSQLNLQRLSAMLEAASPHILGIASEEHNLYYYCTQQTENIEHLGGDYQRLFQFCGDLQNQEATPDTFTQLLKDLEQPEHRRYPSDSVARPVLTFIKGEAEKKRQQLCQSKQARNLEACTTVTQIAKVHDNHLAPVTRIVSNSVALTYRPSEGAALTVDSTNITAKLMSKCFADDKTQDSPWIQQSNRISTISASNILQSSQAEAEATQLLHNDLYAEALEKYQEAIRNNCNNAVAWANLGILFRTAPPESGIYRLNEAIAALIQAIKLDTKSAGWMRHSLCVAEAYQHKENLEQYLNNTSCQEARQLEPINKVLYDKLFYIAIADRYLDTEQYEAALNAYQQSLSVDKVRNCRMQTVLQKLAVLQKKGVEIALQQACRIFNTSQPPQDEQADCEDSLQTFAQENCV